MADYRGFDLPDEDDDGVWGDKLNTTVLSPLIDGVLGVSSKVAVPTNQVRITRQSLPKWTRKRALTALGQGATRVLCIGDSTTAGVYSTSYDGTIPGSSIQGGPNAYPMRLAAHLTAMGIPAQVGMAIPPVSGTTDPRWSGNWPYDGAGIGAGGTSGRTANTNSHVLTLTPGVKVDRFKVYYFANSGTGVFSAQATGGSAVNVNGASGGDGLAQSATISATSASTSNTITLTHVSGTVFIAGVEYWDSTNPSVVRILPAGAGGTQVKANWVEGSSSNYFGSRAFIKTAAADLTIMSFGINDAAAGVSAADGMAAVTTLAGDAAISGDVLLVSAFPHPGPTPLDAYNDLYLASAYPYVDLATRYGHTMMANGLMTNDQTHPNAVGYDDAAYVIAQALAA